MNFGLNRLAGGLTLREYIDREFTFKVPQAFFSLKPEKIEPLVSFAKFFALDETMGLTRSVGNKKTYSLDLKLFESNFRALLLGIGESSDILLAYETAFEASCYEVSDDGVVRISLEAIKAAVKTQIAGVQSDQSILN